MTRDEKLKYWKDEWTRIFVNEAGVSPAAACAGHDRSGGDYAGVDKGRSFALPRNHGEGR